MNSLRCPSCVMLMREDFQADRHCCEFCGYRLNGEIVWRKSKTRLGQLWLAVFCR